MLGINIGKFASFGKRDFVGVDFSSNNLKIVQANISLNKKEITNVLIRDITGLSDLDIAKIIAVSFNELKIKSPHIVNIIPPQLVITKNIEVPSTDPQEIKEIINLQAGRHTPYSREEIVVDYIDIGTYKHNYTKILLVIVARNVIKRQFDILHKAGLKLEKGIFAPESLACSVKHILGVENEHSPVNIINIDEIFTDFIIIFKNKLIFIRNIPIGAQHLAMEAERYQAKFVEELKRSLEVYQSESIEKNPLSFILTGALEDIKGLESLLNETFRFPVKFIPYFNNIQASKEAKKIILEARRQSFLNVITPFFAWGEEGLNLVPEEIKLKKSIEERGRDLIKAGIFTLIIFVLVFSILVSKIYFKGIYLKNLNSKYQPVIQEAKELEDDFTSIDLVKNYLLKRGYSLEVLMSLYEVIPMDVELSDIRFDEQSKFSIKGSANSMAVVFSFVSEMEKSEYFKEVKTKYTVKRKDGLKDLTDFEITCMLENKTNS